MTPINCTAPLVRYGWWFIKSWSVSAASCARERWIKKQQILRTAEKKQMAEFFAK